MLRGDGHWAVHQSASTSYFIFEVEVKADGLITLNTFTLFGEDCLTNFLTKSEVWKYWGSEQAI